MITASEMPTPVHATIAELVLARAEDDNPALLFEDQRWSWREFVQQAAIRSALLQKLRVDGKPFHVGVLSENTPEYLFLVAAAALCGATIVGINPTRRGEHLAVDIRATDCSLVLTEPSYAALLDGIEHGADRIIDYTGQEYADLLAQHAGARVEATEAGLNPAAVLLLLFTSGSTGAPKAVICSTGRWAYICQVNPISFTPDDVAYGAMPLFHGNALMGAWGPILHAGGTYAMARRFTASGFLDDVRKFKATFFNYVGRSLAYVLAQPERPEEADNSLRFGFGTEASTTDRREFLRRYGCPLFESYGSSEGMCYISVTPDTPEGSLGVPLPAFVVDLVRSDGRLAVAARLDDNGRLLNADEAIGEIVSRGAAERFEGYYNNPQASAEKLRDGDFWTGDLAYVDEQGFYWFAGRTSDWLRVDSENFAAAPLERILARFPGVTTVAVYPVPDPETGDQVMATIQLEEAATFDPEAFAQFLGQQDDLGTKWKPALIRITHHMPTTATHKINKPILRRMMWGGDEPIFLREGMSYRLLEPADVQALEGRFALHGRQHLLSL